jgi:hypothetical protein
MIHVVAVVTTLPAAYGARTKELVADRAIYILAGA